MDILNYLEQGYFANESKGIKSLDLLVQTNNISRTFKVASIEKDDSFAYIFPQNNKQHYLVTNKYHTFTNNDFMDSLINYFTIERGYENKIQPPLFIVKNHTFTNNDFMDSLINYFTIESGYENTPPEELNIFIGAIYNFTLKKVKNFSMPENHNFPTLSVTTDLKKYIFKESKYKLIMKFRKINKIIYPRTKISYLDKPSKRF